MHRLFDGRALRALSPARISCAVLLSLLSAAAATAQSTVARISVEVPAQEQFLLQATVPVPPGTFVPGTTTAPIAIGAPGGHITTQIEPVAYFPRTQDGASVVELIARVTRPAGVAVGSEVVFDVITQPHAVVATHTPGAEAAQLLGTANGIRLATRDVNGNRYAADLYRKPRTGQLGFTTLRNGAYVKEVRTHEVLVREGNANGHSLPHMMGVHATFRTYANEGFIALDLHVHNGMDGRDFTTPIDDVVADLYFDRLDLEVPSGWHVVPAIESPSFGTAFGQGTTGVWPIIKALPQNQLHLLRQQGQFTRRYLLAPSLAAVQRGRIYLQRQNLGFCVPDTLANGTELWSWWNPRTSGYLPQRHPLPMLEHMDRQALKVALQTRRDGLAISVRDGVPSPSNYPFEVGALGWAHPWGVGYGGMTGGDEIEQWPGVQVAWARAQVGIRLAELQSQCYEDRQPVALYSVLGRPTRLEDQVIPQGNHGPWMPTFFNLTPSKDSNHFAFPIADRTQVLAAYETYRVPFYEKDMREFAPIDMQHLTRYLNSWLIMAWFTNDAEAKRAIELHAELNRITLCEVYNSNYGHVQGVGLLARIQLAQQFGRRGCDWGRSAGWGLQANAAAYALAPEGLRQRHLPWLTTIASTARAGVSTCTGNPTSIQIDNHFKGIYQSRQSFEVSYFLQAVQGLRRSVFEGVDPVAHQQLTEVLVEGAESTITPPFWNPIEHAQNRLVAVRHFPHSSPDFCTNVPASSFSAYFDPWTAMSVWAYAYGETRDSVYLLRASEVLGGANALAALENGGLTNIADKAAMFAAMQILNR